jgi:hypothetical protein
MVERVHKQIELNGIEVTFLFFGIVPFQYGTFTKKKKTALNTRFADRKGEQ